MSLVKLPDAGGDTLTLMEVDGHYYPNASVEAIRGIRDVTIRHDDVMVCAYPKSGTHWIWEIVNLLLAGTTEVKVQEKDELQLEFIKNEDLANKTSPRILNAHVLVEQMPKEVFEKKTKIIYLLRNPKDTAVSFYHHHRKLSKYYEYYGTFDNYLSLLCEGRVDSGSWFTYVKNWADLKRTHPNQPVLTLKYEDMKEDPLPAIKEIAKFLGVERTDDFYDKVKQRTSFNSMKATKGHIICGDDKTPTMYRKGMVGDWKNHFTVAANERFDKLYKEKMADCHIDFRYTI